MTKKGSVNILILITLILSVPVAVYLSQQPQIFRPKANDINNINSEDYVISNNFSGSPIVIKSSPKKLAGTVYSLTWKGKEFIDGKGSGRQLQSAISFNDFGGCLNPTENGSMIDKDNSSSILDFAEASGNTLRTKSRLAYWLAPGQSTMPYCGNINRSSIPVGIAQNTTILSDVTFSKKVTIGYKDLPNVIEYISGFKMEKKYNSVLYEALTAYLPTEFSKFWTYNPLSKTFAPLSDGNGRASEYMAPPPQYDVVRDQLQDFPIIISTADNNFAMGIYSPDMRGRFSGPGYGNWAYGVRPLGYGRWNFDYASPGRPTKWNIMFRGGVNATGQIYNFRSYVIIGSLKDVAFSIDKLNKYLEPGLSRGEAAQIITSKYKLSLLPNENPVFVDVSKSDPYYPYIQSFALNKITTGCFDNPKAFCPERLLTRAEAITYLARAAKLNPDTNDTTVRFTDTPSNYALFPYVQLFGKLGLTKGCAINPSRFCPDEPITREDLTTFISRVDALK